MSRPTPYAKDVLVDTDWLAAHHADPDVRVLEASEDLTLYASGHVPGAARLDSRRDLWDPTIRDFLTPEAFAALMGRLGVTLDTTVVLYGDKSNWWATYAFWFLRYHGHARVKLVNGGRQKLAADGFDFTADVPLITPTTYPVGARDERLRAYREQVKAHIETVRAGQGALVDVRSPDEFSGKVTHMPDYPQEGVLRGGHIPGATNLPWAMAVQHDGTFRTAEQLRRLYGQAGVTPERAVMTYCRIAERSSHTWFVLSELLGYPQVRNYDGSWTEWGNSVGVPIEKTHLDT
ncbi:sulfurtransferase [Deinococcus maricopensis]|uniref:Sulfurtransferase n=1 Tax=Deinococcus maricopensis (strain DSM 21211 / LMG 22137 / NRRL B-23946 / LB-34) TaxID=709986 RepID=E8U3B2_DEIML|nr:sulfurtransferase [Deinococcus maricopensis]ADV65783.1 Thiosulfate sulfurtransferase [Deinococcus maricopensis DSM 21211]